MYSRAFSGRILYSITTASELQFCNTSSIYNCFYSFIVFLILFTAFPEILEVSPCNIFDWFAGLHGLKLDTNIGLSEYQYEISSAMDSVYIPSPGMTDSDDF